MRVVLTGTYNSANKGDAAMELVAAQELTSRYPGIDVTILSPFPELDAPFYAPTIVEYCNRRRLLRASGDLVLAMVWRALQALGLKTAGWLLSPVMRRVRDADLVVDLSGDMLTESSGPHVAYSHFIPILRALVLGRPYYLCAQSIGPFSLTRPLATFLLKRARAITAREAITRDYVLNLGVRPENLEQTADLAFLLQPSDAAHAASILEGEGVARASRPVLGISVSHLMETQFRKRNGNRDYRSLMALALRQFARETGAMILFVSHVTGPSPAKNDRVISASIRDMLGSDIPAFVLAGDYRPETLKSIIAACDIFCGARMHANIAALSSFVPTVAIAYSHKTTGIMADCGVSELVAPIESVDVDSLVKMLRTAFSDRDALSQRLRERIPAIRSLAVRNVVKVGQLIETTGGIK